VPVRHDVAGDEPIVDRLDDLADRRTVERPIEGERCDVALGVVHASTQIWIDREVCVAHQHLAGGGWAQLPLHEREVIGRWLALGPGDQVELARGGPLCGAHSTTSDR
jgi:hypothetical protein